MFKSDDGTSKQTAYQQQVATVMAPVITANRALSTSLESLRSGKRPSKPSNAVRRAHSAQRAALTAQGGLNVLAVPHGGEQIASNARGTLNRETAYLEGVNAALVHPSVSSAAATQTLASNLTDALNTIAPQNENWSDSVSGPAQLTIWAPAVRAAAELRKAKAEAKAKAKARAKHHNTQPHTSPPASVAPAPVAPATPSGGTDCGGGVQRRPQYFLLVRAERAQRLRERARHRCNR